jgi:hypothetical protein
LEDFGDRRVVQPVPVEAQGYARDPRGSAMDYSRPRQLPR